MTSGRRDPAKGLGRTQVLVLRLLADRSKSIRTLAYDWPGLTEDMARSAVDGLARRGLVDATGWDDSARGRTYGLTAKGAEVERSLLADDESEDGVS